MKQRRSPPKRPFSRCSSCLIIVSGLSWRIYRKKKKEKGHTGSVVPCRYMCDFRFDSASRDHRLRVTARGVSNLTQLPGILSHWPHACSSGIPLRNVQSMFRDSNGVVTDRSSIYRGTVRGRGARAGGGGRLHLDTAVVKHVYHWNKFHHGQCLTTFSRVRTLITIDAFIPSNWVLDGAKSLWCKGPTASFMGPPKTGPPVGRSKLIAETIPC